MRGGRFLVAMFLLAGMAVAGGPRWVTGLPYFANNSGSPVFWPTTNVQYWTDPGDLSASVNHAAADAMVATAVAAWNVPVASMTVSQGGVLAEDVNGTNTYLGSSGPVFPNDVMVGNATAIPVAVIYDADGAVTDMLLGGGASDPGNCRQAAVTNSVDGITTYGRITHALVVVNGRCTGSAPQMQMEMTYRLVRAFGRVLGVGWSQLNDNVFTGVPAATYQQALHWPLMHPMDVMCGAYAYQCLPQPLVLRPDDIATMVLLYPESGADAGKTKSFARAAPGTGVMSFPNGQAMAGVNVVEKRFNINQRVMDTWEETSGVTGYRFVQQNGTLVAAKGTTVAAAQGLGNVVVEGTYDFPWIPFDTTTNWQTIYVSTQAVNPLYTGQYAIGPYGQTAQVTPSGSVVTGNATMSPGGGKSVVNLTATDAVVTCAATADGTESAPVALDATGMWQGAMCGYGHQAWSKFAVKEGRTLTVEMTALDEKGLATVGKMQPVFGLWVSTDKVGTLPTVASAATPMNTATLGLTALTMSNAAARTLRLGIQDQRGDGRPDYAYKGRVLYADSVSPATVPLSGGQIAITGMGFRNGNAVTVNGVAAQVVSWTANTIVAVAPAMTAAVAKADVVVTDLSTQGQTTMTGALAYSGAGLPDVVSVVSVPADGSVLGVAAAVVFGVKVLLADGTSPAVGVGVSISATNGAVLVECGGTAGCVLTTDGAGMVRTAVVPGVSGAVVLGASVAGADAVTASFVAGSRAADVLRVTSLPGGLVYVGVAAGLPMIVQAMQGDGVTPDAGAAVTLTAVGAGLGGCGGLSSCVLLADGMGLVATTVVPAVAGVVSLQAAAAGGMVSASFGALAMPADVLRVVSAPGDGATMGAAVGFGVQVMLGDGVTPAAGAGVTLTALGASLGACGGLAACVLTADSNGMISTDVTPRVLVGLMGQVTLVAAAGGGSVRVSFLTVPVAPNQLLVTSVPVSGGMAGVAASGVFGLRLVAADGVTPVVGFAVTLTASGGVLGVCGAASCVVKTDAAGVAVTQVTATAAGTVRLGATTGSLTVATSFTAVEDGIRLVALPVGISYVGVPTRTPVTMQVFLPDGVTPAAGVAVAMSTTQGTLMACGLPVCVLTADGQGMVSVLVKPVAAGTVSMTAVVGTAKLGTSFGVQAMPPDVLRVVSLPTGAVYTGVPTATPYTLQVLMGDGVTVDAGAAVMVIAAKVSLAVCGTYCPLVADSNGLISSGLTPLSSGTATITATVGRSRVVSSFAVLDMPPSVLTVVSVPGDGAVVGVAAGTPFAVKVMLGDGRTVGANLAGVLTVVGGTLGVCGKASCAVKTDAAGMMSTTVTPTGAGTVKLTATVGAVVVSSSFTAVVPPDMLTVVSVPADGGLLGQGSGVPFAVKVMLADGKTPAVGAAVTMTVIGGTLGACGLASCVMTVGASGQVATAVTPLVAGTVRLTAAAGGGTASASFLAVTPVDVVTVVSKPADGALVGSAAPVAFAVKVTHWDGSVSGGAAVTVSVAGGRLGACGLSSCVLTADAVGVASSSVTPTGLGTVGLTAASGGGTVAASFAATVLPPDVLTVVSVPESGGFAGRVAAGVFRVTVVLWDGSPPKGAAVTVTAVNGTVAACGGSSCVLTADALGTVSTAVTPVAAGVVGLTASAGGGTVAASFTAVVLPADALTLVSVPASGGFAGRMAAGLFAVKVVRGDGTVGAGVPVTVVANGGTLAACGGSACVLTADGAGMASSAVTAAVAGTVGLTASVGAISVAGSFTAVALPSDTLTVLSVPADGGYVGRVADGAFRVRVTLGDGAVGAGASVVLTASGGTLGVCGAGSCVVAADGLGVVSSSVTASTPGAVRLTAVAGGGTVGTSFTALAVPLDTLTVASVPAGGGFVGRVAAGVFAVKVMLGDGTVGAGVSVAIAASGGTLAACGAASCVLVADGSGMVSTSVTPLVAGTVGLTASVGAISVAGSFAVLAVPPDTLTVVSVPANGGFVGKAAAGVFAVKAMLGGGTVGAGVSVTVAASGGTLAACGAASCVLVTDAFGVASTGVTPLVVGKVGLTAVRGSVSVAGSFTAVAVPADIVTVVSAPANGSFVGDVAGGILRVKVTLGDGVTAAGGVSVAVTAAGAMLGVCGGSSCDLVADAAGMVSTSVTPMAAGTVVVTAAAGGGLGSVSFAAVEHVRTVTMARAVEYVAAGAVVRWTPVVVVSLDGGVVDVPVVWTGMTMDGGTAVVGPLEAGNVAAGKVCAWGSVCAGFQAVVVDEAEWGMQMVRGGGQVIGVGGVMDGVVVKVVDASGHGVAGASVMVRQVVRGYVACPAEGRCPVGAALGSGSSTVVSDADGQAVVMPMVVSGVGETTEMVFLAGSSGFLRTGVSVVP